MNLKSGFTFLALLFGLAWAQPDVVRFDPYSLVKLELEQVWGGEGQNEPFLLTDTESYRFSPGSYVYTDENGEGWIQLIGEDNRRCGWVYVFQITRLMHAPCPKSAFTSGSVTCMGYGTSVFNNKCEGDIYIETPSATVQPQGTYFAVTYLPGEDLSIVQMYEGEALVWPVLDGETRALGDPDSLPAGFFWFSAPEERRQTARGLAGRVPHPLEELPTLIEAFNLVPWQERIVKRAQADRQDVPDAVAAAVDVVPLTQPPYLGRLELSPRIPGPEDSVRIEVAARDTDLERIEIRVSGEAVTTCSVSPCSATVGPFGAGNVSFEIIAYDQAGNSRTREGSFRVRLPPSESIGLAPDIVRLDLAPARPLVGDRVTVLAEVIDEDADLDRLEFYADGRPLAQQLCGDYQCLLELELDAAATETNLELRAFDQAGHVSVQSYRLIASLPDSPPRDELALSVEITPPAPTYGEAITIRATLSGASEGVERLDIFLGTELLTSCDTATCQVAVTPPQVDEPQVYRVEAADGAGRSVSKEGRLTLETPIVAEVQSVEMLLCNPDIGSSYRDIGNPLCVEITFTQQMASETLRVLAAVTLNNEEVLDDVAVNIFEWSTDRKAVRLSFPYHWCSVYTLTLTGTDLAGNTLQSVPPPTVETGCDTIVD